jgi:hypothetical protein
VVKKYCNLQLRIKEILLTRYNARTILGRAVAEILIKKAVGLHTKLYKTVIRNGQGSQLKSRVYTNMKQLVVMEP